VVASPEFAFWWNCASWGFRYRRTEFESWSGDTSSGYGDASGQHSHSSRRDSDPAGGHHESSDQPWQYVHTWFDIPRCGAKQHCPRSQHSRNNSGLNQSEWYGSADHYSEHQYSRIVDAERDEPGDKYSGVNQPIRKRPALESEWWPASDHSPSGKQHPPAGSMIAREFSDPTRRAFEARRFV
jgi:hypothetical protein